MTQGYSGACDSLAAVSTLPRAIPEQNRILLRWSQS